MKLIPLAQAKKNNPNPQFAMVDDEDYDYLMQWKWSVEPGRRTFYAVRLIHRRNCIRDYSNESVKMHRVILGLKKGDGKFGDHKDSNGLNNQRYNLRVATPLQNASNCSPRNNTSSQYKGVHYNKKHDKWVSRIQCNKSRIVLGTFLTEIEAAIAYNEAAPKYHREFAKLNTIKY